MSEQNQFATSDRLQRAEEVQAAANAFFDTLNDTEDALTVFHALRSRFNLMGTVFTDRDVRDILGGQMEDNDLADTLEVLIPSLSQIITNNFRVGSITAESMAEAGGNAMEYDIADYIHPLLDGNQQIFPVVLGVGPDGADAGFVEFSDAEDAVKFAQSVNGSTVTDALRDATAHGFYTRTLPDAELDAVVTATHLVLTPGGFTSEEDIRVKIG